MDNNISKLVILALITLNVCYSNGHYNFDHIQPTSDTSTQERAVRDLIQRLIPDKAHSFVIEVNRELRTHGKDEFKVYKTTQSQEVKITASSGVAAAWGFHHYLKYYCNCHVSWEADQLKLPETLPDVNITITANDRFRYYQNVCTVSYSFVWWSPERWVREIDWMAMNGINLALAFTAQEEIWRRVYLKIGMDEHEINDHFTGPAFFAWGRMGNIRGWGGPLSNSWHNQSVALQMKILKQMRDIGITSVLPAFAGQVPRAFKRLFPNALLELFDKWNNFPDEYCCPYLLSPEDPLFLTVGKLFLNEYIAQFGTDHIYNCDTFNEMVPLSGNLTYLHSVGRSIYTAMSSVDKKAIWILQGWLFENEQNFWNLNRAEAFLKSVPLGKMIVLDLQAELNPQYKRLDSFFGLPFIWCMLHNFGGTLGMHGSATQVNEGPFEARNDNTSNMVGTGLTPEGINQNYVMYDLMNEMAWRRKPTKLDEWFDAYSIRRYGVTNKHTKQMWQFLRESVYNYTGNVSNHGKYIFVHHPSLKLEPLVWYNKTYVINAWDECIKSLEIWPKNKQMPETFIYDIVDITRQSLQLLLDDSYLRMIDYFIERKISKFTKESQVFLSLLKSLEEVLSSHKAFLLKPWIQAATSLASTKTESMLYEINARNQITLWGPNGEIKDYANKQWAGVVHHYYYPRWELFFKYMKKSLIDKTRFNQTEISDQIFNKVEHPFSFNLGPIHETYTGNAPHVVKKIYSIWRPTFDNSIVSLTIVY